MKLPSIAVFVSVASTVFAIVAVIAACSTSSASKLDSMSSSDKCDDASKFAARVPVLSKCECRHDGAVICAGGPSELVWCGINDKGKPECVVVINWAAAAATPPAPTAPVPATPAPTPAPAAAPPAPATPPK